MIYEYQIIYLLCSIKSVSFIDQILVLIYMYNYLVNKINLVLELKVILYFEREKENRLRYHLLFPVLDRKKAEKYVSKTIAYEQVIYSLNLSLSFRIDFIPEICVSLAEFTTSAVGKYFTYK